MVGGPLAVITAGHPLLRAPRRAHLARGCVVSLVVWSLMAARAPVSAEPIARADARGRVVDWSAGELRARGLGVADRRAPSPATARDAARGRALADAHRQLADAARALPWAGGGTLGDRVDDRRLLELAARARVRHAEPLVDGSWRLELALPLEVLRQAVTGPRALALDEPSPPASAASPSPAAAPPGAGSAAPVEPAAAAKPAAAAAALDDSDSLPVVVVTVAGDGAAASVGAGLALGPALGLELVEQQGARRTVRAPTLWAAGSTAGVPLAAAALAHAPTVIARLRAPGGGALEVASLPGSGRARVTDATLVVVVLGK